jgi:hypothetical protein
MALTPQAEATGARRAATVVATEEAHTLVISKSLYDGVLLARQQRELHEKVSCTFTKQP